MNRIIKVFLYNMWGKSKGPGSIYIWFFILTLMVAYVSTFSFLVGIFGTTTRVFPAIYLAIAAISWGIRGAIPVTVLNIGLNLFLFKHAGRAFEGGVLGPAGCLFATCLVGTISDLARQLDQQLQKISAIEAVLRDSEKRYRGIFNMVSDAILLIDGETGQILEANESASKIYGYSHYEFLQMKCTDISAQPEETRIAILEQKKHIPTRYHKKRDGNVFPAEITAEQFTIKDRKSHVIAIRDITSRIKADEEKKRLEAQFYQAQKMESIGTLAGGIAHDFNNLLGGILGHSSLALLKTTDSEPSHEHLAVIEKLAENGGKLTKHILGFARGGKYEVKPTNLNELISRHSHMFGRTHKNVNINQKLEENLWTVEVDQEQIEQVLFNIYINSVQAMPGYGTIFATTENTVLDNSNGFSFPVKQGEYVKISINDTGSGMDETTKQKIFEPFYSTKEKGVGTGLGMAAAYGIIKNHDGYIHVQSEPQKGTTIIILLPRSKKILNEDTIPTKENIETGSGTILVVDDEEEFRKVATEMLQVIGYDTLAVESGSEAIALFKEKGNDIDLVILDIIMPDMDGRETFERLKKIDKNVKVLFQTGYTLDETKGMEFPKDSCGVFRKPFSIKALSEKCKKVLN